MKYWLRVLFFQLARWDGNDWTVYGRTFEDNKKPKIVISGSKFLSPVKDNFVVKIYNLPYSEIAKIQLEEKFHIQIFCGYLGNQPYDNFSGIKIFDGGVMNITQNKQNYKDTITTFVCTSKLVAQAQQFRMGISFNSGINMYSMLKYLANSCKLNKVNIDEHYKEVYMTTANCVRGSASSYLESLASSNNDYFFTSDASEESELNCYLKDRGGFKYYTINPYKGMIINGQPKITSNGINFTSLPVFNYMCGDLIKLDNSEVDTSSGQDNYNGSMSTPNSVYLQKNGLYYIYELSYNLENDGGSFQIDIVAKSKDLFDNVTGGASNGD